MATKAIVKTSGYSRLENGMTLIDVAIALLVIGLLALPLIQVYNMWQIKKTRGDTEASLIAVENAISDFYYEFGRYPCPAELQKNTNDDDYGEENCTGTAAAAGTLAGAVPFLTLKMPRELSFDGWGNKLTYVVTKDQTDPATYNPGGGIINIKTFKQPNPGKCDLSGFDTVNSGHFVLVSHGTLGIGSYNAEGRKVENCPSSGASQEAENCDYMSNEVFLHQTCAKNDNPGKDYYDDLIAYEASTPTKMWNYSLADPNDIFSDIGNVGINNEEAGESLDVVGNVKLENNPSDGANNGNMIATTICDNDNECMYPELIYGDILRCGDKKGLTQIKNNGVYCDVKYRADVAGKTCPAGKYITAISQGSITCGP